LAQAHQKHCPRLSIHHLCRAVWPMGCCKSSNGDAPAAAEKDAQSASENGTQKAIDPKHLLHNHFLGNYRTGIDLSSAESSEVYAIRDVAGDIVYEHRQSGVKTWTRALDVAPPGTACTQLQVLFHYTTESQFTSVCGNLTHSVWSQLQDDHGLFGSGVYCSPFEAAALGSQENVSRHTKAFCLDDWEEFDFCIPIIASKRDCLDLRLSNLPEMVHGCGKTMHGRQMEEGVDVWVYRNTDGPATALKSLRSNTEERLRMEVIERKARLGTDHAYTFQSMISLISCLKVQGKTLEAERYASGTAADVEADASLSVAPPSGIAPVAGAVIEALDDQAAITRAAAAVLAATQGVKGLAPPPQRATPGRSPGPNSRPAPLPSSKSNDVAVEPSGARNGPAEMTNTQGPNIAGEQCMSLDDLESEASSMGHGNGEVQENGAPHSSEADQLGDVGVTPVAEIADLDANLQWGTVCRDR